MKNKSAKESNSNGSVILVIMVVVVLLILGIIAWRIHEDRKKAITSVNSTSSSNSKEPANSSSTPNKTDVITNDPAANSDLQSINVGINQDNSNLNSSSTAVNDQQNEIAVPTD